MVNVISENIIIQIDSMETCKENKENMRLDVLPK